MDLTTFLIQCLNAVQYGLLLFLIASGLTLIFGIMGVINLAHGSFYMIGAYMAYALAPMVEGVIGGGFFATLLVGLVLMRLSGHFVAVATLGFLVIVRVVLVNADEDDVRQARIALVQRIAQLPGDVADLSKLQGF